MGRINKIPDDDAWEDLLSRYEAMKASGNYSYLDAEEIADLANHYLNLMEMEEVSAVIEYGLKLHPDSPVIRIEQGFYYLDMDQPEKAREVIRDLSEDWNEEVVFLKVELSLIDKNVEEARRLFETLDYAEDKEQIIRIACVWLDTGFADEALAFLERFLDKYQGEEEFLSLYAESCQEVGKLEDAIKYFNILLDRHPYSATYWVALARCYYDLEEYGKCIEACDFALAAEEQFTMAHLFRGDALFMLGEDQKTIAEYQKGTTFQSLPSVLNNLFFALKYFSQEKYKEAIPYLMNVLEEIPDEQSHLRVSVYYYLPSALLITGEIAEARKYCHEWLKYCPRDVQAHLLWCRISAAAKNDISLEQAIEETLTVAKEAEELYELGQICMQTEFYQYAVQAFEKVKSLDSGFKNIDLELLNVYLHYRYYPKIESSLEQLNSEYWNRDLKPYWQNSTEEEKEGFIRALIEQVKLMKNDQEENKSE